MVIVNYIMSIKSFTKNILRDVLRTSHALWLKFKYWRTICRLKRVYGKRKIVVAFCVSDIAKWKSQVLYDQLTQTNTYRPVIFVYPYAPDFQCKDSTIESRLDEMSRFFTNKGMNVVNVWDTASNQCVIPEDLRPDIIFYQQPWDTPNPFPLPTKTAAYALSFYVPYFLINNFDLVLEVNLPLHYRVFGHIVQNEELAAFYDSKIKKRHYAGKRLGLGHTIVDNLATQIATSEEDYVIYAPHFSIPVPEVNRPLTYSTFLDNGKLILEFAKQHPEINWVFKPHPLLKTELKKRNVWSAEEVDAYYTEWARIGIVCETPDYIEHFQKSSAMITDCGSFLTEYSCMDKPLIRLYYHKDNLPPHPALEQLYGTFYYAHDNAELQELLESVICQHQDPNKDVRHEEVVRAGLNSGKTSRKIIDYLDSLLS